MKLFGLFGNKKQAPAPPKQPSPYEQYRGAGSLEELPNDRKTLEAIIEEAEARHIVGEAYELVNLAYIKLGAVLDIPAYYSEAGSRMLYTPDRYLPLQAELLLREGALLGQYLGCCRLIEMLVQWQTELHFDPFEAWEMLQGAIDDGIIEDGAPLTQRILEGCHMYSQYHEDSKLRELAASFLGSYYSALVQEDSSNENFSRFLFWQLICSENGEPISVEFIEQLPAQFPPNQADESLAMAIKALFGKHPMDGVLLLISAAALKHPDALMLLASYLESTYDTEYEGLYWMLYKMAAEGGNRDAMYKLHATPKNYEVPVRDCRFDFWAQQEAQAAENNDLPYMLCRTLLLPDPAPDSWERSYPPRLSPLEQYGAYEELPADKTRLLHMTELLTRYGNKSSSWLLRQCYKRLALGCSQGVYLLPYALELLRHGFARDGQRILRWVADADFPKELLLSSDSATLSEYFIDTAKAILREKTVPAELAEGLLLKYVSLGTADALDAMIEVFADHRCPLFDPTKAHHLIRLAADGGSLDSKSAYSALIRQCQLAAEYGDTVALRRTAAVFLWRQAELCAENETVSERRELMFMREAIWRMAAATLGDEEAEQLQSLFQDHWDADTAVSTFHGAVRSLLEGDLLECGALLCAAATIGSAEAQLLLGQLMKHRGGGDSNILQYTLYAAAAKQAHPDVRNMRFLCEPEDASIVWEERALAWDFPADRPEMTPSLDYVLGKLALVPIPAPREFWYPPHLQHLYKYKSYEDFPDDKAELMAMCAALEQEVLYTDINWLLCQCRKKLVLNFNELGQLIPLTQALPALFSGLDGLEILASEVKYGSREAAYVLAKYYEDRDWDKAVFNYIAAQTLGHPDGDADYTAYLKRMIQESKTTLNPSAAAAMLTHARGNYFSARTQAGEDDESLHADYVFRLAVAAGAGVKNAEAEYRELLQSEETQKGRRTLLIREGIYSDGHHPQELSLCIIMDALLGNIDRLYDLALALMEDIPVPAHHLLTWAAKEGSVDAMLKLGWRYGSKDYPFYDLDASEQWFLTAFEHGSPKAAAELGAYKHNAALDAKKADRHSAADAYYEEARLWFERGEEMGSGFCKYMLGLYYRHGLGGLYTDREYSKYLILQAAEMGVQRAIDFAAKHF